MNPNARGNHVPLRMTNATFIMVFLFSINTPHSRHSSAEDFLIEQGFAVRPSPQRQKILGCLACRWNTNSPNDNATVAYGYEIGKCSGVKSGVLYPTLRQLEKAEVLTSKDEPADEIAAGRPGRKYYVLAESELGVKFASLLEPPVNCNLEQNTVENTGAEEAIEEQSAVRNMARELLDQCTAKDLTWIIAQAQQKLDNLPE